MEVYGMLRLRVLTAWTLLSANLVVLQAQLDAQVAGFQGGASEERSEAFAELAAEFNQLQIQGNLLKKVVRLVKPTVVHLESYKSESADGRFGSQPQIEEAGSGVIIRLDEDFYRNRLIPFLGEKFIQITAKDPEAEASGIFGRLNKYYKGLIEGALRRPLMTIGLILALFIGSL